MKLRQLKVKWDNLFQSLKINLLLDESIFNDLVNAYSDPTRYYHNLQHIEQLLTVANLMREQASNFPVIELAIWFHDVIYDSQAQDNEVKSAAYAEQVLTRLEIDNWIIQSVKQLILQTQIHQTTSEDFDSQFFLDADLSILGANQTEYQIYSQAIRQEYAWLSKADYYLGRKKILESFLARTRIYQTEYFFNHLEDQARANLQQELLEITSIEF
jgi:predicted metal-dependent HD superfamily phosphohydrolase